MNPLMVRLIAFLLIPWLISGPALAVRSEPLQEKGPLVLFCDQALELPLESSSLLGGEASVRTARTINPYRGLDAEEQYVFRMKVHGYDWKAIEKARLRQPLTFEGSSVSATVIFKRIRKKLNLPVSYPEFLYRCYQNVWVGVLSNVIAAIRDSLSTPSSSHELSLECMAVDQAVMGSAMTGLFTSAAIEEDLATRRGMRLTIARIERSITEINQKLRADLRRAFPEYKMGFWLASALLSFARNLETGAVRLPWLLADLSWSYDKERGLIWSDGDFQLALSPRLESLELRCPEIMGSYGLVRFVRNPTGTSSLSLQWYEDGIRRVTSKPIERIGLDYDPSTHSPSFYIVLDDAAASRVSSRRSHIRAGGLYILSVSQWYKLHQSRLVRPLLLGKPGDVLFSERILRMECSA